MSVFISHLSANFNTSQLLSGDVPYSDLDGKSPPHVIADNINRGVLPYMPAQMVNIPGTAYLVLEQCLQPNPSERPTMSFIVEMLS